MVIVIRGTLQAVVVSDAARVYQPKLPP